MTKRICNWCAQVGDDDPSGGAVWHRARLRIEGLDDGSISWLPELTRYFCSADDCIYQLDRVEDFVSDFVRASSGILVHFTVFDNVDGVCKDEQRFVDSPEAALDVRALARFFHETSHPKLRRLLEAFESETP